MMGQGEFETKLYCQLSLDADAFSANREVSQVGFRYAAEHARYSATNRVLSRLVTLAQFGAHPEAELLRSSAHWKRSGRHIKAAHLNGPDAALADLLLSGSGAGEIGAAASAAKPIATPAASTC